MHIDLSSKAPPHGHVEPLRWIGAYKLAKAALALVGGLMVLRLVHRDLPEVALHLLNRLRIDPHSPVGHFVLRKVIAIHGRNLRWLAVLLFAYTPLSAAEGIGLIMRKVWAEWLTLVATCLLIPVEIYECFERPTWVRIVIFMLNVVVLIYLIVRLRRDRARRTRAGSARLGRAVADTAPSAVNQPPDGHHSGNGQE